MEDTLISFETAKLAKEKGFDWKVEHYIYDEFDKQTTLKDAPTDYSNFKKGILYECISQPTQSLLQKWLREVHGIIVLVDITEGFSQNYRWKYFKVEVTKNHKRIIECIDDTDYETYEKALEIGLQEGLKQIKNGSTN